MNPRNILLYICIVFLFLFISSLEAQQTRQQASLVIRCDDIGMCHAVNGAFKRVADLGIPVSASVMFGCAWYQEAVDMLKQYPNVSIGVHLTLNAEWKNYRWGPIVGKLIAPSLVDSCGYFFPSRAKLFANNPVLKEAELELRAQIERAKQSGLRIDYFDYHMGAAVQTLEFRQLVESLAKEYGVGISRYLSEEDIVSAYAVPAANKLDTLIAHLNPIEPGQSKLLVFHVGLETPEMDAMEDMNTFGLAGMSKHRQAELEALVSPRFQKVIAQKNIELINYKQLIERVGLMNMKRPKLD